MAADAPKGPQRFRPDDGCPLFSETLEHHLVEVLAGRAPNRGRFCGHCYTPFGRDTAVCPHCGTRAADRAPVEQVPAPVIEMLRGQRKTERWIVNTFAFAGLLIALVGGLAVVLVVPFLRDSLVWATIAYAVILLVGGRVLAGVLGGYYGDRIAYDRARSTLRRQWVTWVGERDAA
jgi:hypothetical protein